MQLEIVTIKEILFEGSDVQHVQLPGKLGSFGIMDNHAPLVSELKKGRIKVEDREGDIRYFEIGGGVAEVKDNKVTVLAE